MSSYDVIVVGGGAAGLSAALNLGRASRRTLLVDAGRQSNLPAHGIGGLLGHDGLAPAALYAKGREELATYPSVELRGGEVVAARPGFVLTLASGEELDAPRVLLAMGMDYTRPELPGLEALWGDTVFHCPFCHGWEVRGEPLAAYGHDAEAALHQALMLTGWSDDVVALCDAPFTGQQAARLAAAGVRVDARPVASLRAEGGKLAAVVFADGSELPRGGLLLHTPLRQRTDLAEQLGAVIADSGVVAVDARGFTSVPGLSAAGDQAVGPPSVATAIASGGTAGAMLAIDGLLSPPAGGS